MRIAIDARMIKAASMHGIARYVYELLAGIARTRSTHEIFVFIHPESPLISMDWPNNFKLIPLRSRWIGVFEHWELPRAIREHKVDLFHSPSFVAPLFTPCKMIMTIHDLNHLVLPQFYTPLHQLYYRLLVRNCIRKSELILTVSEFSRKEIVKYLAVPAQKIHVTHNGVSDAYHPIVDQELIDYVREIYELPERFIFCLTNKKPHKNVMKLTKAYCESDLKLPLVLACPVDLRVIRMAETYGKKHQIYFAKYIQERHLPVIYSMTELFVYPSTYEGFGLPPLEALACGAPVVVANSSSLPEVVGEHALYMDPFDHVDMAQALERGVRDTEWRSNVLDGSKKHARTFSWNRLVSETLALYDRCQPVESEQLKRVEV